MSSLNSASRRGFVSLGRCRGRLAGLRRRTGAASRAWRQSRSRVVTLEPQTVTLTRELPGRTTPFLVAEVRPQVDGIVKQRLYTEGGSVKAGQPLYQLDDATYRADVASARPRSRAPRRRWRRARLNAARSAELVAINAVSKQDDENAVAALQQAEADVAAAQAAVQSARRDPRLRAHHLADHRPHRQVVGDAGRAGDRQPGRRRSPPSSSSTRSTSTSRSRARSGSSCARRSRPAASRRGSDLPVTILLEDGTRVRRDGKLAFSDVTRRSDHRQLRAARRGAEPGPRAAARHVRARDRAQRRARERAARAAAGHRRATRRATPPRWSSARTARSRCAR